MNNELNINSLFTDLRTPEHKLRLEMVPAQEPLVFRWGVIAHYNSEKHIGFIKLDVARADGRDVFFHRNNGCDVFEVQIGRVGLSAHTRIDREPQKGDRVVLYIEEREKGPAALNWTFEALFKAGLAVIKDRPAPDQPLCRVVDCGDGEDGQETVLWTTPFAQLADRLAQTAADLDARRHVKIEQCLVHGWQRLFHKRYNGVTMSEEELLRGLEGLIPPEEA